MSPRHSNPELAQRALSLFQSGLSYREVARQLRLKSRYSAAGYIRRARIGYTPHPRRQTFTVMVGTWVTEAVRTQLNELAAQWDCSLSEVLRTLIICGLEDLDSGD